jgi:hypothetical protein
MADDIVSLSGEGLKFGRSPANGELLVGNGSGFNLSTLTAGSNVTITNSSGGITISATSSGGTVTSVTGTAPITSTGGATPNIALTVPVAVQYGGTGLATITANSLMVGNGTGSVSLIAPGANGNLLTSDGTTWTSAAPPAAPWTLIEKTADQTVTASTTFANDTHLQFPVVAGTTYMIRGTYYVNCSNGGATFAINGPTASRILIASNAQIAVTAYDTSNWNFTGTASVRLIFPIYALVLPTASGTIAMRVAQNSAAGSAVFQKGSFIEYTTV